MKMTNEDILTLAKAGFTAAQIAALNPISTVSEPMPGNTVHPEPQPAQEPKPEPAPAAPAQPQVNSDIEALIAELKNTAQVVQNAAIRGTQQPKQETVEDILASIINPPEMTE